MHDGMPYGRIQGQGQDYEPIQIFFCWGYSVGEMKLYSTYQSCHNLSMPLQKLLLFDNDEEDSAADDDDNELRIRHEFSGPEGSKVGIL